MSSDIDITRRNLFRRLGALNGTHPAIDDGAVHETRKSTPRQTSSRVKARRKQAEIENASIRQNTRFTRRSIMMGAGGLGLFSLLAAKLYALQEIEGRKYRSMALSNRLAVRFRPSKRGRIHDRAGRIIASNTENLRVLITPDLTPDLKASLDGIEGILGENKKQRRRVLRAARRQNAQIPILVREGLSWGAFARINAASAHIPGVSGDIGWRRRYHFGQDFAHIAGTLKRPDRLQLARDPSLRLPGVLVGGTGIEKGFDDTLLGKAGRIDLEVDAKGRRVREIAQTPVIHGGDISLTIDQRLQGRVFERLKGYRRAAVVALDVANGDVLSCNSTPSFDANILVEPVDPKAWNELRSRPDFPMSDKAVRGQYPPGSTFKMVTALAGLEAGVINEKTTFTCKGAMHYGGHKFHCWNRGGHGPVRLRKALQQSCDVYFYQLARRLGIKKLARMAHQMGLGEVYDCGLPDQKPGLIPDPDWKRAFREKNWLGGETVLAGIGQGYVLSTPLQLAVMTARIATGRKVEPRFARPYKGSPLQREARSFAKLDIDESFLDMVRDGMNAVVNSPGGTAKKAALHVDGHKMAGKTGTSQVRRNKRGAHVEWKYRDHALFVAYAPVKNPRYAVSVIIEHGESGGKAAAPVARDVLKLLFDHDGNSPEPAPRDVSSTIPRVSKNRGRL